MPLSTTTTSTLTGALAALHVSLPADVLPLPPSSPPEINVVDVYAGSQSSKPAWSLSSTPAVGVQDSSSWPTPSESIRKTNSAERAILESTPPRTNNNNNPNLIATPNHSNKKSMNPGGGEGSHANAGSMLPASMPQPRPRALPNMEGNNNRGSAYNGSGNRRGGGVFGMPHDGGFANRRVQDWGSYVMYSQPNFGFGGWEVTAPPPLQHRGPPPPFHRPPMPAPVPPHRHRGHPRPFVRPPPPSTYVVPFTVQPQYVPPYMNPMVFQDILPPPPPPPPLPYVHIVSDPHARPPPLFIPGTEAHRAELLRQVHFYFSYQNLCKDVYLRQFMDEYGWVPISLIAGFNCMKRLTSDIEYIREVLQTSTIVEIQGYKIRLRNNWKSWILPSSLSNTRSPD